MAALRHLEPTHALRERSEYSNLGYVVAGSIIDRVSGQRWEAFTAGQFFRPLGLESFGFSTDSLQASADFAMPHPRAGALVYPGTLWPMHAAPAGGSIAVSPE
jgi:CubicO group peptidase (beta-lactamase class C family)